MRFKVTENGDILNDRQTSLQLNSIFAGARGFLITNPNNASSASSTFLFIDSVSFLVVKYGVEIVSSVLSILIKSKN